MKTSGQLPKLEHRNSLRMGKQKTVEHNFLSKNGETPNNRNSLGNLNQNQFFKEFSSKLDQHQNEIENRNKIIQEMEKNIELLKGEYIKEKHISNQKEKYIAELQETLLKMENKLKAVMQRMEELQTKCLHYEKALAKYQSNDSDAGWKEKEQKYINDFVILQNQVTNKDLKIKELEALSDSLNKKYQNLEQQLLEAQKREQDLKNINSELSNKLTLNSQDRTLDTQLKEQIRINENFKKEFELLKKENETLKTQVLQASVIDKQSQTQIAQLNQKITLLTQELDSFKTKNVSDEDQNSLQLKKIQNENEKLKQQLIEQQTKFNQLQVQFREIDILKGKLESSEKELQASKEKIKDCNMINSELQKDLEILRKKLKEQETIQLNLKSELLTLKNGHSELASIKEKIKKNNEMLKKNIEILEKNEKEIMKSLKCNHCSKTIQEPVTIIPCGHNYCFNCKVAYQNQCIKCGPKVKIEAMYRNELLDDILGMTKIMQDTREQLRTLMNTSYS